jgi:hypothetical protein
MRVVEVIISMIGIAVVAEIVIEVTVVMGIVTTKTAATVTIRVVIVMRVVEVIISMIGIAVVAEIVIEMLTEFEIVVRHEVNIVLVVPLISRLSIHLTFAHQMVHEFGIDTT